MVAKKFETSGLNHLALICSDMKQTVDFYEGMLGFKLVGTADLSAIVPGAQHFFFDIGNDACLAFMYFPGAPEAIPGNSVQDQATGSPVTGIGSMNHVAIDVPAEFIDEYRDRLNEMGIDCTDVINHDSNGRAEEFTDEVISRSIYFYDPDGIRLEFCATIRAFGPEDVRHEPANPKGKLAAAGV